MRVRSVWCRGVDYFIKDSVGFIECNLNGREIRSLSAKKDGDAWHKMYVRRQIIKTKDWLRRKQKKITVAENLK